MSEEKGIKESLEALDGIKLAAMDIKAILADGKVNLADLPILMTVVGQFSAFNKAVSGVSDIPAEMANLSAEEINQLAAKALELVAVFKAA